MTAPTLPAVGPAPAAIGDGRRGPRQQRRPASGPSVPARPVAPADQESPPVPPSPGRLDVVA